MTDGSHEIGVLGRVSSTDGIGMFVAGYTRANVTTAQPTLVLSGYAKDIIPNNNYDAAVSVRGYNVADNSTLQNLPIFKVLNAHNSAYLTVNSNGNVGIGTTNPDEKLTIKGKIHTEEVKVDLNVQGPDYVFESDYNLQPLEETKKFIQKNKHLPEIPSANEMEATGIKLGEMNMLLLKKIEELTLHLIEQNSRLKNQEKEIEVLKGLIRE